MSVFSLRPGWMSFICVTLSVKNSGSPHRSASSFFTVSTFGQSPIPSSVCVQWACPPQRAAETRTCEKLKLLSYQHMFLPGNTIPAQKTEGHKMFPLKATWRAFFVFFSVFPSLPCILILVITWNGPFWWPASINTLVRFIISCLIRDKRDVWMNRRRFLCWAGQWIIAQPASTFI